MRRAALTPTHPPLTHHYSLRQVDELEGIPVINLHMWFDRKLKARNPTPNPYP